MNFLKLSKHELLKVPYMDKENLGSRLIPHLMFYTGKGWRFWTEKNGTLVELPVDNIYKSIYFGYKSESDDDLYFHFVNVIVQKLFWPEVARPVDGILNSIHKLAASLGKYSMLYEWSKTLKIKHSAASSVETELEYLLITCRGVFDLLQETMVGIWKYFKFLDDSQNKKIPRQYFREIVFEGKSGPPRTAECISDKWNLPLPLAEFYEKRADFFSCLKRIRDEIIHRGASLDFIFVTDKGFAVPKDTKPFVDMDVWDPSTFLPNGLAPLNPIIGHIVNETLVSCEEFINALESIMLMPSEVVPGQKVFLRGFHFKALRNSITMSSELPWFDMT